MNLPKHIEERFDEEFKDYGGEYSNTTDAPTKIVKSFIAQILEEEKERLFRDMEKNVELVRDLEPDSNGRYNACNDIINLIKNIRGRQSLK